MQRVGVIRMVARYPVKSMRGEAYASLPLTLQGFEEDRRFAFVQAESRSDFPWLTARQMPELLLWQALLSKVAETCRNIKAARFESEEITERTGERSGSRTTTHSNTLVSQPGKLRVETTGSREPTTLISDGQSLWQYFPDSNEFIKMPAGAQPLGSLLIGPLMGLDAIREPARIIRQERVGETDCTPPSSSISKGKSHSSKLTYRWNNCGMLCELKESGKGSRSPRA